MEISFYLSLSFLLWKMKDFSPFYHVFLQHALCPPGHFFSTELIISIKKEHIIVHRAALKILQEGENIKVGFNSVNFN